MAEKRVKVKIDVDANLEPTIANLKVLKKQLRETAAGSAEFNKIAQQIRDMDDAIKDANATSDDFLGYLENASGPLGMLGQGIRNAEKTFSSFNAVLKTSIIGIVVAAIGGLVAAFSKSETAMKKLEPLWIGLEKILGGIFRAFEPVLDAFIELATQALPYITKGIGMFYSGLYSLFTLVKNVGVSVGKILKGVFTLDFDALKEGASQIKDAFTNVSKTFDDTYKRFEAGTKEQTKTEKENAEERQKNAEEAARKRKELEEKAAREAEERRKKKEEADKAANEVELEAFKATLTEREREEYEAGIRLAEQRKILADAGRTDATAIEEQYRIKLAEIKKKYDDEEAKKAEEKAEKDKEALLKKQEIERGILLTGLQERLEALDAENQRIDFDFEQDLIRLGEQRSILAEQEALELQNTELNEFQKTEIRKKYADARKVISDQEIATEKAAMAAKHEINMAYLGLFEQFGGFLSQIAGKNKALAIAGVIIQQAASIGQIIANTGIANAKAVAASPLTFGMPWVAINTVSAGLSIAASVAGAVKSISEINKAAAQAGVPGGGGGSVSGASSTSIAPPRVAGAAAPQIQSGQGMNASAQIAETISAARAPVKAYVVSGEVSSQQALDRRTSRAATFTGG